MKLEEVTQKMIDEFKVKANRLNASDNDVRRILRDFNGE